MKSTMKSFAVLAVATMMAASAQASLVTINSGVSPQPANSGKGTIESWIATGVATYNASNPVLDPDLPAPGLEVFRVNKNDPSPGAGYPTFGNNTLSITISTADYEYIALHWGGQGGGTYQSFYIGDLGGVTPSTITFNAPGRNGLSWYDAFLRTPTTTNNRVPDAGSSMAVLGVGLIALGALRRKLA